MTDPISILVADDHALLRGTLSHRLKEEPDLEVVASVGTTDEVRFFSEREIDLCTILAHQISLALHNASLYEQAQTALADLSRAYNATLEGWSHLLDIRDHITDEHTGR